MPSIIPRYEYDIFISYRHKDNKGEHWVTEFVNALRTELEATFKEDISIYFDENPHDGLLEIHNVDKSLEGKLRCLIFIPIISQTYCDPKSFAWLHEFCAFNRIAKEDKFGRDIRLNSGNIASRILPIRIHDLDVQDKSLIENELGGPLRSIDFIFKSPGVNRSLLPVDNPEKNFNKTHYRDQINKVANGVKEIIQGLMAFDSSAPPMKDVERPAKMDSSFPKIEYRKLLKATFIAFMVIVFGGYFLLNSVDIIDLSNTEQNSLRKFIFPVLLLAIVIFVARYPTRKMGFTLMQIATISVFVNGLMALLYTLTHSSVPTFHTDFLQMNKEDVSDNLVNLDFALIRTLGTSLMAVGIGTWVLLHTFIKQGSYTALYAFVIMITLAEGNDAAQMYALRLPLYMYTVAVVIMSWIGAILWWKGDPNLISQNQVT